MNRDKPECQLEDWSFDNGGWAWSHGRHAVPSYAGRVCLIGKAVGHPTLGDAGGVTTTPVLEWDFENHGRTMVAYTKNTKYVLGYPSSHWSYRIPRDVDEFFSRLRFETRWRVGRLTGIGQYGFYRWPDLVNDWGEPLPDNPWLKRKEQ